MILIRNNEGGVGKLEDLKCWEAWDSTCGHKAKDITPLTAWRREAWKEEELDNLPWKDERGPSSIRRTLELFQRQRWGNFWKTGCSAYGLFRAHKYHLELNWTQLNWRRSKRSVGNRNNEGSKFTIVNDNKRRCYLKAIMKKVKWLYVAVTLTDM